MDSDLRLALLVYLQVHGLQLSEREGSCEKDSSLSEICLCFALGNFQGECGCHQDYFFAEKAEIQPALVRFHTDLKSEASLVALANSITLTPGTYTVELENGEYVVQALDRENSARVWRIPFCKAVEKVGGMSV